MNLNISTGKGYAIAAALRGPDVGYPALEHIVTRWIRERCEVPPERRLGGCDFEKAKREIEHLFVHNTLRGFMEHWVRHCCQAIDLLEEVDPWVWNFTHVLADMLEDPTEENKANALWWLDNYRRKVG